MDRFGRGGMLVSVCERTGAIADMRWMATSMSILGFGAFGRFMSANVRGHFDVGVFDARDIAEDATAAGVRAVSLSEAAKSEVIVLAVPVQRLEGLLAELSPLIPKNAGDGALVVDVSSVKVRPIEMMTRLLPRHVRIVGTHPLFGPQSGGAGIGGLPVAVCPARADAGTVEKVRSYLGETLGLRVVDVGAEEHDRQMAYVQALTHLVSRALGEMPLPRTELATVAYERLLAMRANLAQDSWELFVTIERENPFAGGVRAALRTSLNEIERRLGGAGEGAVSA